MDPSAPETTADVRTVAERTVELLAAAGVRRIYGLPGEDHLTLLAAFEAQGIEYRAAQNESSAVIMAGTDSQVSGVIGVALLSMAPGISNGYNGLLHAYLEGLPIVVMSGRWPAGRDPLVVRQGFDCQAMVGPVTKWATTISTTADPASIMAKVIEVALAPKAGPVYVELPDEVAQETTQARDSVALKFLREQVYAQSVCNGPLPAPTTVERIYGRLLRARYPVLVIGGRCRSVSTDTVAQFATRFRVPVLTSPGQMGALPASSPYFAGTFINSNFERQLFEKSDLVLALNPEAYDFYNTRWANAEATISVSDSPLQEWLFSFDERFVADPGALLAQLCALEPGKSRWTRDDVTDYKQGLRNAILSADAQAFSVASAVAAALEAAPDDAWIVADAGFSKPIVSLLAYPSAPGRFLASNALSTMGYAIPAAIGAAAAGAHPVVAFTGDGSLIMRASELVGLTRQHVVVVAIIDGELSQIGIKQLRRGLPATGVALPTVAAESIGGAFGVQGVDVYDSESLQRAVRAGIAGTRPVLIGAHVSVADSKRVFELLRG